GVEGTLRFGKITKASERKHFGVQRAMEALVLAAALRVIRPAVQNSDVELEQPHTEPGPTLPAGSSPRTAVVDEEGFRQPVAAKGQLQSSLHGAALLVGAGFQTQVIARMVVQDSQGMASASIGKRNPAFEIHLPEQIWCRLLKPLMGYRTTSRAN